MYIKKHFSDSVFSDAPSSLVVIYTHQMDFLIHRNKNSELKAVTIEMSSK